MLSERQEAVIRRIPGGETITVQPGTPLKKVLKQMRIPRDSVVALKEGQPVPEDTILKAGDEIELINVISGGKY